MSNQPRRHRALAEVLLRSFTNPRWLCHHCGQEHDISGLAYPICECGHRCRCIAIDNGPYVGDRGADQRVNQ